MDPRQISFVKFIFEAYDNIAVISTLDSERAVMQLSIAPGCESLVDDILRSLGTDCNMRSIDHAERAQRGSMRT